MKYFIVCSLLVIYMAGTCFRPVAAQFGSSGRGLGSANNGASSHTSGTNENQGSATVGGVGRVLGTVGLASRSTGSSDTNLQNSAVGGGSGSSGSYY